MTTDTHQGHTLNTLITMQMGFALMTLLALEFLSAGLFYLYHFNYDIGPFFNATQAVHFYAGLASIPFLLAKYGSTGLRFAGYYLRVPRFAHRGPPKLWARVTSPLLAADFFVLYFSGLYMLFHYYYTIGDISPFAFKPVQLHLLAAVLAVPLVAIHLGMHLVETLGHLQRAKSTDAPRELKQEPEPRPTTELTRRAFLLSVAAGGLGLAYALQNTPLKHQTFRGLFIGRIPKEERGGPGDFPVEVLFGKEEVDAAAWRLGIKGAVSQETMLTYDDLMALPAITKTIRISCVSGWSAVPTWSGPRVRDVLALAGFDREAKAVEFRSLSGYVFTWHIDPLLEDDALLATHVNGAPLSENHGFPTRLILPGYPGQNMVKQLDQVTVFMEKLPFNPDLSLTA